MSLEVGWRVFLYCLLVFGVAMAKDLPADALKGYLKARGISEKTQQKLMERSLIGPLSVEAIQSCSQEDNLPFNIKFITAEKVVEGQISSIQYLYKEGGVFRTIYTIEPVKVLKGHPQGTIKVFSQFGPNSKDHRRWKRHPTRIEFQVGDHGVFLLNGSNVKALRVKHPEVDQLKLADYVFEGSPIKGAYILTGGELDAEYITASRKKESGLSLLRIRSSSREILNILEEGKD